MKPPRHLFVARLVTLAVWLLLCALPGLHAQSTPSAKPKPPATFRLLSTLGSHTDLKYEPALGQASVPLLLNQTPSARHPRPSSGVLNVFRELPLPTNAPPGSRPPRQTVFEIRLPPEESSCLVITQPAGGNPSAPLLDARVLPDDSEQHGAGLLRVLNLSDRAIAVALGGHNQTFAPGALSSMRLPETGGRMLFRAAATDRDGGWNLYYKGEQRLAPIHRGFLIVTNYLDDPDYGTDPTPPPVRQRLFFEFAPTAILSISK